MGSTSPGAGPPRESIGDRLARIARLQGERRAIVEGGGAVTFAALAARSAAIARRIVAATSSRPGTACLLFDGKRAAIEAAFGVLRAGRAYVPLDAADPDERLRFIVADSAPAALLTEGALLARAQAIAPPGTQVLDAGAADDEASGAPLPAVEPGAPALVCYTSGSTGAPKGVVQTHANLLFFCEAYAKTLALVPGDRFSLLYTLSFAAGNNGVMRSLLCGATLCAYDLRRDGVAGLAAWLDRERITVLQTVPTVFRAMCDGLAPERQFPHLRAVHLAGEAMFARDVERFRRHTLAHCLLMNQLGSTEACIVAQHVMSHGDALPATAIVPVGRPVPGVDVAILREDGSPAAPGETGEIVVASARLAAGYWRRPDLDAAAFDADPQDPARRRFHSGDLGRLDAQGDLHFVGRRGRRIKLRGHSVDLAEVEAALAACEGVAEAAVVATGDDLGEGAVRLVALVAVRAQVGVDARALRRALATRLPAYMLPSITVVDRLPLGAGGKIDRAALAARATASARDDGGGDPPRDDVERELARLFAELLALDAVGRDDDFFACGGDSLQSGELQMRVLQAFGVRLGPLHDDASVAAIARTVREARAAPPSRAPLPMLVPLWRLGSHPPLFLVHGRHGQAHVSPHFMRLLGDEQPAWAFQARGLDDLAPPHETLDDMADDYVAELRKQAPRGPYFLGSLCVGAYVVAAMARRLAGVGEQVLPLLLLDPPNRMRARVDAHADPARVAGKMKARKALGRIQGPLEHPRYLDAAVRTAAAFNDAVARHHPQGYDGPAYVLSSRQRMHGDADWFELRTIFTGRVKRYEVGTTHGDALDPRNPVFASTLVRCVGLIRSAAADAAAARASP